MIILDTNVVSELMRATPDQRVAAWVATRSPSELATTAITVAAISAGLGKLPEGRRRDTLDRAAEVTFAALAGKVLLFDLPSARRYGGLVALRERSGRPISVLDAQIASICLAHDAVLATRDRSGFSGIGLRLVDPWSG